MLRVMTAAVLLMALSASGGEPDVQPIAPLVREGDRDLKASMRSRKARLEAQNRSFDELRGKILAAIARLKRDPRRAYLEVEDILTEADRHIGRDIATVGLARAARRVGFVDLADGISAVPVSLFGLPAAERKRIESLAAEGDGTGLGSETPYALVVLGRLARGAEPGYLIEASSFSSLGRVPEFGDIPMPDLTLTQLRRGRDRVYAEDILTRREKLQAALRRLERDPGYRYVEIEELIIDREKYSGRDVATVGLPIWAAGYLRAPYFDLKASYASTNHIPALFSRLPLESRKELLRGQYPPHLVVLKGRVTAAAGNKYYLAAVSSEDLGQDFDSPAEILKPNLEPLAPFDGDVKKFRKQASHGVTTEAERRARIEDYRTKLLAAAAALRRDRAFAYVELEDVGLDPGAYLERDIAAIGVPCHADAVGPHAHFMLANKSFGEISLPVLMSGFSAEMKKEIVLASSDRFIAVRGRLRRSPDRRYYIEAAGYSDLGQPPHASGSVHVHVSDWLEGSGDYIPHRDTPAARKKVRDAVAAAQRYPDRRFVAFKEVLRRPAAVEGRPISILGVTRLGVVQAAGAHLSLFETWDSHDPIPVLVSGLPLDAQKRLFRVMNEDDVIIEGRIRRSAEGKYYLEASGFTDIGPYPMAGQ